jgi:Na+-translocating ferredoxin:NAD+ oxidoreductase subunit A
VNFAGLLQIAIGAIFINNFVLAKMLGIHPILSVSSKLSNAFGLGFAATLVMTVSSAAAWCIDRVIILPHDISYIRIIVFVIVIVSFVQLLELVLQKFTPALFDSFGKYLPLIAANCVVLAAALMAVQENPYSGGAFGFIGACANGAMSGIGFMIALVLLSGIRGRLECANVWKPLEGAPIALISAGLLGLAFLGLSGLRLPGLAGGY